MARDDFAQLGAWEDRPHRVPTADLTAMPIDAQQAFVWTRLDGVASIAEVCAMTGLGEGTTLNALTHLVGLGAVTITPASGQRTPITSTAATPETSAERAPRSRPPGSKPPRSRPPRSRPPGSKPPTSGRPRRPAPAVEQIEALPDFNGVSADDTRWLMNQAWLGFVPGMPWARPGEDRFGRFKFDTRQLLERCELSIAVRKEIIFLDSAADRLDHFEYLGMAPSAEKKDWRRAYFRFSKRFHPDTFFRRDVGSFGPLAEKIYARATQIHDAFSSNDDLRTVYFRAVTARNQAYRDALETARLAREAQKQQQIAAEAKAKAEAEAERRAELKRQAIRRKAALRDRLDRTTQGRRERRGNPMQGRIDRAAQFYEQGMQQYEREKFVAAATSLQLAKNFDPKNTTYAQAYERVSEKANAIRAEQIWKRGFMQESVARFDEAMVLYAEAVELQPRPDFCIHLAELMLSMDQDMHRAAKLCQIACAAQPENVDYLLVLARIYERESLVKKATATLEKAAKLSPKDERIKKAQKALKRL